MCKVGQLEHVVKGLALRIKGCSYVYGLLVNNFMLLRMGALIEWIDVVVSVRVERSVLWSCFVWIGDLVLHGACMSKVKRVGVVLHVDVGMVGISEGLRLIAGFILIKRCSSLCGLGTA